MPSRSQRSRSERRLIVGLWIAGVVAFGAGIAILAIVIGGLTGGPEPESPAPERPPLDESTPAGLAAPEPVAPESDAPDEAVPDEAVPEAADPGAVEAAPGLPPLYDQSVRSAFVFGRRAAYHLEWKARGLFSRFGDPGVSDDELPVSLATRDVSRTIRRYRSRLALCKDNSEEEVLSVDVEMSLLGTGRVGAASADSNDGEAQCVVGVVREMRFPEFSGETMTFTYPFRIR